MEKLLPVVWWRGAIYIILAAAFSKGVVVVVAEEDCPFGIYGIQAEPCICLSTGLWAVALDYCTVPVYVVPVAKDNRYCLSNTFNKQVSLLERILTFEVPEVGQMSNGMEKFVDRFDNYSQVVPFPEDIFQWTSTLVTYGATNWTLITTNDLRICLKHDGGDLLKDVCFFREVESWIKGMEVGCDPTIPFITPTNCELIQSNRSCDQSRILIPSSLNPNDVNVTLEGGSLKDAKEVEGVHDNLIKRQDTPDADDDEIVEQGSAAGSENTETDSLPDNVTQRSVITNEDLLDEDEDAKQSGLVEIGHKLMRGQIDAYVDTVVVQLSGLSQNVIEGNSEKEKRFPALQLLRLITLIMQRTCVGVEPDFLHLALNSFLKVQMESFHAKEPYLAHNSFRRIEYALKECYNNAKPHTFYSNASQTCPGKTDFTSNQLDMHGDGHEILTLPEVPAAFSGIQPGGTTFEPLIETVWKMLVNAHSYCYPNFKAYFNDHHTLTVALLPLFNNQIQDLWLSSYDERLGVLYGGLLGNTKQILQDVDHCVLASRFVSAYPWYMSRPIKDLSNKWKKRKRRDLGEMANIGPKPVFIENGTKLCMFDPDDPVAFLGKPVC